jgi:hypothetical protein
MLKHFGSLFIQSKTEAAASLDIKIKQFICDVNNGTALVVSLKDCGILVKLKKMN